MKLLKIAAFLSAGFTVVFAVLVLIFLDNEEKRRNTEKTANARAARWPKKETETETETEETDKKV